MRHLHFVWSRAECSKPLTLMKEGVAHFVADRMRISSVWVCIWMKIQNYLNNSYIFLEWIRQGDIAYEVSYTCLWVTSLWDPTIHSIRLETTSRDLLKLKKNQTHHPTQSATKNILEDFNFFFSFSTLLFQKMEMYDMLVPAGRQSHTQLLPHSPSSVEQGKTRENRNEKHFGSIWSQEDQLLIITVIKTDFIWDE